MIQSDLVMQMYKYAAFDLDGTLLDTMDYWRNLILIYARLNNIEIADKKLREKSAELDFYDYLEYLKKHCDIDEILNMTEEQVLETIEYCYKKRSSPRDGVAGMLEALRSRGIKMCVISATPTKQVLVALKSSGLSDYFEFVLTADDYPEGKSGPEIFLEAARRFGCRTDEMAMFEDSLYSMKTAKRLGMYVVAVKEKYSRRDFDEIALVSDEFYDEFTSFRYPDGAVTP